MLQPNMIPTPHISAKVGDFARTVLMPGDPLRSRFIAQNFLSDAVLVNDVRGVQGYTGYYQGKRVSVMASGMGMPAMGIYSYELFNFYDVDAIIRVGSAGSVTPSIKLRDVVMGRYAVTDSRYGEQYDFPEGYVPSCDNVLLLRALEAAQRLGVKAVSGKLYSSDVFYDKRTDRLAYYQSLGISAVEMESAALYINADQAGKRALCICTVSDSLVSDETTSSLERQNSFTEMIRIALMAALE